MAQSSGQRPRALFHHACVKIRLNMEAGDVVRFTTVAHVAVKSYTWWDHDRVDARFRVVRQAST